MTLKELNHKSELNIRNATIWFNYEELRDIANGLYKISKEDEKYCTISAKMNDIFHLVKDGQI